jgi:hypothetical protein
MSLNQNQNNTNYGRKLYCCPNAKLCKIPCSHKVQGHLWNTSCQKLCTGSSSTPKECQPLSEAVGLNFKPSQESYYGD